MTPSEQFLRGSVVRRFLLAEFVVGTLLLGLVLAIYRQDVVNQRVILSQEAEHVLDLQHELLLSELRGVQSDLLYLANQELLQQFLSDQGSKRPNLEQEYINFAQRQNLYDQIRFLDTSGQELVRINYDSSEAATVPHDELQSKESRYYFQQSLSLKKNEIFVSPFDLNVEHGEIEQPIQPVIRFVTPVYGTTGTKQGLLVLNYLGTPMLKKLREVASSFRGETMLLNPAGQYLQSPDPTHEWGWLLGHSYSFRQEFSKAWLNGKDHSSTQIRVEDDLFTFRMLSPGIRLEDSSQVSTVKGNVQDPSGLVLVSRVSSSIANAHSNELLHRLILMLAVVMGVMSLLTYYWAHSAEIRHHHESLIAESEARLRQLSTSLLETQEAERRTLSRTLHDELGQLVTAMRLDLGMLKRKQVNSESRELLQRIIGQADSLLRSLHEIASNARPSVLDDLGLHDAIESFISEYQERRSVTVNSQLVFNQDEIPTKIGENAYRIVVEALSNVARHAEVDSVQLTIKQLGNELRVSVRDGGVGFDAESLGTSTRLGILGMRERAELLNGSFRLISNPGQGAHLVVVLPLASDGKAEI